jgi:phage gp29-like protein
MAIINGIIGEFADLSRQNLQDWRQYLEEASHPVTPRWAGLQDLFDYLEPDSHYGSQAEIRKGVLLACRFYVRSKASGKEDEDKTGILEKEWFYNLLNDLGDSSLKKVTAVQIRDAKKGKYDLLPRRNIIPQKNMILTEGYGNEGFDMSDPAWNDTLICVVSPYRYGIMNDIVPDLIWKKNARQAWASFSSKFGLPLLTATTNKTNKADLDRIEYMLKQLGEAARAVLPEGTTLKIDAEAKTGDPYQLFLKQIEYSDASISKRLVGGTMVSDNGSSHSQSETHAATLNNIIGKMERKRIAFAINDKLLHSKVGLEMGFTEDDEFVFDESEELSLADYWKIVEGAMKAGLDIDLQWLSETFNLKINGRKDNPPVNDPKNPGNKNPDAPKSFFD